MPEHLTDTERRAYREKLTQWLAVGYVFALVVVGTIAGTAHLLTGHVVDAQSENAAVVNVSGRQRMLSQRIALLAERWNRERDVLSAKRLAEAVELFERSHSELASGRAAGVAPGTLPDAVRNVYFEAPHRLDARTREYVEIARGLLRTGPPDDATVDRLIELAVGQQSGQSLLFSLDQAVRAFEQNHVAQIDRLKRVQNYALLILIAALLLEGLLIYRPMVSRVQDLLNTLGEVAVTDPLTGIYNRRGFEMFGKTLVAQRRRGALLTFDIDHFKRVNDTLGHAAGDLCIKHVASLALDAVRDGDIVGRIGGEEYAVVLMGGGPEHAVEVAERLRASIEANSCMLTPLSLEQQEYALTVSIGLVPFDDSGQHDLLQLLEQADGALYTSKDNGRNRVTAVGAVSGEVPPLKQSA